MPMSRPHQAMSQRPAVHRISHPFAADYIPGSFSPLHSSSLDPSTRSSPRRAPKPVASKPTPVTPQRRRFVSEAPPKTPVPAHDPAPIPLSTPPPRSAPSDPQPPSAHSPRGKRRLIRPDSRVHRDRKKSKKTHYWELKPISKHDPVWKGLYTLEEVNEAWVRAREEFLDRSNRFERNVSVDSPATSIATKHEVSSSPDYHILSARASSQLLVPTPEPELASKAEMTTVNELPVSQSDQQGTFTPPGGFEDPFDLDSAWIRSLEATPRETLSPNTHRPPPLNLLRSYKELPTPLNHTHPYAYQEEPSSMSSATRMKLPDHPILLSPLPIPSPGVWEARRVSAPGATSPSGRAQRAEPHVYESELRWAQNCAFSTNAMVDLESAMEELLASAGERSADILWLGDSTLSSPTSSHSEHDMSETELFFMRPLSRLSRRPKHEDVGNDAGWSFPLPPVRPSRFDTLPPRPPREDDMGLGLFHSPDFDEGELVIHDDLGSPVESSPPPETPRTPDPCVSRISAASPPRKKRRERTWKPQLTGDHSFLEALSRGEDPTAMSPVSEASTGPLSPLSPISQLSLGVSSEGSVSSSRSSSSRKRLPKRTPLPETWKTFGRAHVEGHL